MPAQTTGRGLNPRIGREPCCANNSPLPVVILIKLLDLLFIKKENSIEFIYLRFLP